MFIRNHLHQGDDNFASSVGWLDKWKKRYGVCQLDLCGENLTCDSDAIAEFIEKFLKIWMDSFLMKICQNKQIYNCDETSLKVKMLPSKRLLLVKRKVPLDTNSVKSGSQLWRLQCYWKLQTKTIYNKA